LAWTGEGSCRSKGPVCLAHLGQGLAPYKSSNIAWRKGAFLGGLLCQALSQALGCRESLGTQLSSRRNQQSQNAAPRPHVHLVGQGPALAKRLQQGPSAGSTGWGKGFHPGQDIPHMEGRAGLVGSQGVREMALLWGGRGPLERQNACAKASGGKVLRHHHPGQEGGRAGSRRQLSSLAWLSE
jgi:hypothetical protein